MGPGIEWHEPVLVAEVLEGLAVRPGGRYVDMTVGDGGHSRAILERSSPDGIVLAMDRDGDAVRRAERRLSEFGDRVRIVQGNFADCARVVNAGQDGILFDLGTSSLQFEDPARGFSVKHDGPLDMRMDSSAGRTAADLVNSADTDELERIIREYGEEWRARRVAKAIAAARAREPITTTGDLARIVGHALGWRRVSGRLDPATRVFQAIRIAVNDELDSLRKGLHAALGLVRKGGRVAVLAFHSLEDRIVKQTFHAGAEAGRISLITRRPLRASMGEVAGNPRARSARLRVVEARG